MKRALIVALREVKAYFQDKGDLAFSLLLPIITFALIYGAFGGSGLFHGTAYIVNQDINGIYGQQLIDAVKKQDNLDLQLLSFTDAESKLNRSDVNMVFLIPADFSANLDKGQPTEITIMQRGNGGQEGQIVASIVSGLVSEINQQFAVVDAVNQALAGKNIPPAQITVVATQFLAQERQSPLVTVKDVSIGVQPNTVKEFLPGIVTMYVLFAISIAAAAIVDERRKGTLERLITTRLTIGELFLGKFMANVFRGFIQTFILLVLSYAVFQIFTPLTFVASLFIALLFATACSAIGLLLASLVKTPDSATWIGVFITMGMTMLGGTFFAIEKGSALYPFSKLSINGYANTAFKTLINGGGISTLGVEISVLVGVTIVALILSRLMFKAVPQGK